MGRNSLFSLVIFLALSQSAIAIMIRDDRSDERYQQLAVSYPQVVHMNLPDGEGALIGSSWVVTAAHIAELIQPGHTLTVGGRGYTVKSVHLHPGWDGGPNDIAVVEIAGSADEVAPVQLYRGRDEEGQIVTVVGTGDTGTGASGPTSNDGHLRAATNRVDVASEAWVKFKFDRGDAATDLEGISGPGDSGGPAFLDSGGVRYLIGVSSGQSTRATGGREGVYGVTEYYTRVSSYAQWIDSIVSRPVGEDGSASIEVPGDLEKQ